MKKRSFLPLLGLAFIAVLFFLTVEVSHPVGVGRGAFISTVTFLITFGTSYVLHVGSFFTIKERRTNLKIYRIRWLREVLIL